MTFRPWLRGQARSLYRQLRHPRHRKNSRWRAWLGDRVLDRDLWKPHPDKLAWGFAVGLFISMQPIPVQTPVAIFCALKWRLNLPAALIACALTNPATWVFTFVPAGLAGGRLLHKLGLLAEAPRLDLTTLEALSAHPFSGGWGVLMSLVVGCLIGGLILAVLGFWIVRLIYRVVPPANRPPSGRPPLTASA
jgi:uncharacterized protein